MTTTTTSLLLLYGSETGTAESIAHSLWRDARCRQLECRVMEIDEYDIECLRDEKLIVFIVATCGQGEAPTNMQNNWRRLLSRSLPFDYLSQVSFAVVGLGDSSYDKYNFAAKRLYRRILQLGAHSIMDLSLADDQHPLGVEGVMNEWSASFWPAIQSTNFFSGFDATLMIPRSHRIYQFRTIEKSAILDLNIKIAKGSHAESKENAIAFSKSNPFRAVVVENRELHSKSSDRSCRHIEFSLDESIENVNGALLEYNPGDHLGVFPANDTQLVEKIARLLGDKFDLDVVFDMVDVKNESFRPFPCPCSYRTALTHYIDICTPVRPHILGILADYTSDEMQREKLELFASTNTEEGADEYSAFIRRARRSIVDILEQFNTCSPPMDLLLEVLPRLQPRFYSISSSLNYERWCGKGKYIVSITSLTVNYKIGRRSVNGVCTNYLAEKKVGDTCEIFLRKSSMSLPYHTNTPVIMIGPGTGLAPFRGFLQERYYKKSQDQEAGEMVLFFGCRNSKHDYIYKEELEDFLWSGTLSELHLAFSREDTTKKIYVQNHMWECRERIWKMINKSGAYIYVCGDAKNMAQDVKSTFLKIFQEVGGLDEVASLNFLKELERQQRYQADVWS